MSSVYLFTSLITNNKVSVGEHQTEHHVISRIKAELVPNDPWSGQQDYFHDII